MEYLKTISNWSEKRGKVKSRYPKLADKDLNYTEGKEEELVERLHVATGKKREELIRELNRL